MYIIFLYIFNVIRNDVFDILICFLEFEKDSKGIKRKYIYIILFVY